MCKRSNITALFDRGVRIEKFQTWDLKHFPLANCLLCKLENVIAPSQKYPIMIDVVAHRRRSERRSDLRIREAIGLTLNEEFVDLCFCRSLQKEHFMKLNLWKSVC